MFSIWTFIEHARVQPAFCTLLVDALQPQECLFTQLLRWLMWYWCTIEPLTTLTFFLLVSGTCRSTKNRFEMCSILELWHCRSEYMSTIVCIDDINTHECYLIRATPHTVTLSRLIDVESRLIYSSFFCGVSKVVTHLDYDVFYLDVNWARASATII